MAKKAAKKQSAVKQSAAKKQSKVRYDDFVADVQRDPAKPEATVMLTGFLGHGADDRVRIYPDASLGTWYEVAEDDIVHSMPIADSKLGGSYVWARASAQIRPGSAAGAIGGGIAQTVAGGYGPPGTAALICTETCPPGGFQTAHHCVALGTPATLCSQAPGCPAVAFAAAGPAAGAAAPAAHMMAAAPVGTFQTMMCQTAAPCGPSLACTALPCALSQMACAAPQAFAAPVGVHTNPPTLGCSGGCYALGAYPARTGVFTPYC